MVIGQFKAIFMLVVECKLIKEHIIVKGYIVDAVKELAIFALGDLYVQVHYLHNRSN